MKYFLESDPSFSDLDMHSHMAQALLLNQVIQKKKILDNIPAEVRKIIFAILGEMMQVANLLEKKELKSCVITQNTKVFLQLKIVRWKRGNMFFSISTEKESPRKNNMPFDVLRILEELSTLKKKTLFAILRNLKAKEFTF